MFSLKNNLVFFDSKFKNFKLIVLELSQQNCMRLKNITPSIFFELDKMF